MFSKPKSAGIILSCALLACLGALSGCQSPTGKTVGQTMNDASISTAVQTKLTSDRLSNFPRINVDTERGVVNLSGVVETEAQRERVERLARQVDGVIRVNNNLQIQNRPPSGKYPNPEQNNDMKDRQPMKYKGHRDQANMTKQTQGADVIQGQVVRVEGETYVGGGQMGKKSVYMPTPLP